MNLRRFQLGVCCSTCIVQKLLVWDLSKNSPVGFDVFSRLKININLNGVFIVASIRSAYVQYESRLCFI